MLKTRKELQKKEDQVLAPYAVKSLLTLGRVYKETHDDYRLPFQRDRDRIIRCRAFRRLQAKTQVFVSYFGDHYRDRLTHSIEVAQIARDISRRLGLNEDLTECIALAHDLGHPPFGHGGQTALNEMMMEHGLKYEHNEQSRRILQKLERLYPGFDGLNVTKEVLDGLLKHGPQNQKTYIDFVTTPHLETQVADLADEIAYTNHDLDDGLRSEIITLEQLSEFKLWQDAEKYVYRKYGKEAFQGITEGSRRFLSRVISRMIGAMIHDLQETTLKNLARHGIDSVEKVRAFKEMLVGFSETMVPHIKELRKFLFQNFYSDPKVNEQIQRGQNIIKKLFNYYRNDPKLLPELYQSLIESGECTEIVIKDYIAGMTDHFAEEKFNEII